MLFFGGFFCFREKRTRDFAFVSLCYGRSGEEICMGDMPWPPAAECNMITNKQTDGHNVKSKYQVEELVIEGDIVLRCSLSSEHKGWWNLAELRTRSVI